jgi:hypothetical protein
MNASTHLRTSLLHVLGRCSGMVVARHARGVTLCVVGRGMATGVVSPTGRVDRRDPRRGTRTRHARTRTGSLRAQQGAGHEPPCSTPTQLHPPVTAAPTPPPSRRATPPRPRGGVARLSADRARGLPAQTRHLRPRPIIHAVGRFLLHLVLVAFLVSEAASAVVHQASARTITFRYHH